MGALYWNGRNLEFESAYRTPVAAGQTALVKVHLAGICSTDLQILKATWDSRAFSATNSSAALLKDRKSSSASGLSERSILAAVAVTLVPVA